MPEEIIINRERIIPVIGENAFEYTAADGSKMSLQEFIVRKFFEKNGVKEIDKDDAELKIMLNAGYYGLTKLKRRFPTNFQANLYHYVSSAINKIHLKPTIKDFLDAFSFPLVITTTGFDFIENDVQIYVNKKYYVYDVNNSEFGEQRIDDNQMTVFHIFGKAANRGHWVNSENELLKVMYSLNSADVNRMCLKEYMKIHESLLMVLDVNVPDWTFRFMMYPLQRPYCSNEDRRLGYWCSESRDESFQIFLEDMFYSTQPEVEKVLKESTSLMNEIRGQGSKVDENGLCCDIAFKDTNIDFDNYISKAIFENLNPSVNDESKHPYYFFDKKDKSYEGTSVWWMLHECRLTTGFDDYIPFLIFDQFEEIFNNSANYEWTDKFFIWLKKVLANNCPTVYIEEADKEFDIDTESKFKLLFSLRADSMGELDYWCSQKNYIPQLLNARFCLKPLTLAGAQDVISLGDFSENIQEKIVKAVNSQNITKEDIPCVSALMLSMICSKLSTNQDVEIDGDTVLRNFYQDGIKSCGMTKEQAYAVETVLVSQSGHRARVSESEQKLKGINLKALKKARIIKGTIVNGDKCIELVHDSLCKIIVQSRFAYEKELEEARFTELEQEKIVIRRNNQRKMFLMGLLILIFVGISVLAGWKWQEADTAKKQERETNILRNKDIEEKVKALEDALRLTKEKLNAEKELKLKIDTLFIERKKNEEQAKTNIKLENENKALKKDICKMKLSPKLEYNGVGKAEISATDQPGIQIGTNSKLNKNDTIQAK